jgi:hypothetical protein
MRRSSPLPKRYGIILAVSVLVNIFFLAHWLFRNHGSPKPDAIATNHSIKKNRALSTKAKDNIKKLKTLGYMPFYKKAPKKAGITRYVKEKAYEGLNLYSSAYAVEAVLMDMEGQQIHKWKVELPVILKELNPDMSKKDLQSVQKHPIFWKISRFGWWRKLHLYKNGDIMGLITGSGLVKLDINSNIIWKYVGNVHHQMVCADDGYIYVLERQKRFDPKYNENESFIDDLIVILDQKGNKIKSVSVLDCLENSDYRPILSKMEFRGDLFHTNTIFPLDNRFIDKSPAFRKGNILVSCRELNLISIIDFKAGKAVWGLANMWKAQHQPEMLSNGHMLVFDNQWRPNRSRIIEFDPFTRQIYWTYQGTPENPFFTSVAGAFQTLPNGNLLIVETEKGRAFEIMSSGEIVWEFISPHRFKNKKGREFIYSLFQMTRINQTFSGDFHQLISKAQ